MIKIREEVMSIVNSKVFGFMIAIECFVCILIPIW